MNITHTLENFKQNGIDYKSNRCENEMCSVPELFIDSNIKLDKEMFQYISVYYSKPMGYTLALNDTIIIEYRK